MQTQVLLPLHWVRCYRGLSGVEKNNRKLCDQVTEMGLSGSIVFVGQALRFLHFPII